MSVFTNIQIALDTRLNSLAGSIPIAWENVAYKPVEGTTFIRPTTLYAGATVEDNARTESFSGIYQIDCFVEVEKGPGALNTLLDSVRDHFKGSLSLTGGSDTVIVRDISRIAGERDGSWYRGSIEVAFICYSI